MSLKEVIKSLTNQKPRKLFSHLYRLQDYGVGRQFTRVIWKFDDVTPNYKGSTRWGDPWSYWTITRVKPDGVLRSGRVWGKLTWRGELEDNYN
jgi:small subunit ribosomal protein S34